MTAKASKTFLITGVSSGLGRAFAAGAIAAGHRVIGTVRKQADDCAKLGRASTLREKARLFQLESA